MWFIGVEVEQETRAPPPKRNPGSAPESVFSSVDILHYYHKVGLREAQKETGYKLCTFF